MKQQELIRFVGRAGQRFRLLLPSASGAWLICYEHPTAPFFVNEAELVWFERIVTPDDFMKCRDTSRCSTAYCERLDIIQPLLEEEQCICNKELRKIRQLKPRVPITPQQDAYCVYIIDTLRPEHCYPPGHRESLRRM